ncbi:MAG: RluA family pseudouridine synthase [Tepidanaerobacteraceae bacterium]
MSSQIFTIDSDSEKKRLDVFLSEKLQAHSRTYIKRGIQLGWVKVNDQVKKPNYRLKKNDEVTVNLLPVPSLSLNPEPIPINIIFEDNDLIILNKQRGMVVYPAPGNYSGTVVNALLYHTNNLSSINGNSRPGIVHRLDKGTSGVMIVAKNNYSHRFLSKQLKNRQMIKTYLAVVHGSITENISTIDAPIGRHPIRRTCMTVNENNSKAAVTHFKVLERFRNFTYLELQIETGRTHQIRVHMKFIGHPVVGDPVYSRKKHPFKIKGQALHAYRIQFLHPTTRKQLDFEAPIPDDFMDILNYLRAKE